MKKIKIAITGSEFGILLKSLTDLFQKLAVNPNYFPDITETEAKDCIMNICDQVSDQGVIPKSNWKCKCSDHKYN
jgi:hypothetical protein